MSQVPNTLIFTADVAIGSGNKTKIFSRFGLSCSLLPVVHVTLSCVLDINSLAHCRHDGHTAFFLPGCSLMFGTDPYGCLQVQFLRSHSYLQAQVKIPIPLWRIYGANTIRRSSLPCRVFAPSDSRFFDNWEYTSFSKDLQVRQARRGNLVSNSKMIPRDRLLCLLSAQILPAI